MFSDCPAAAPRNRSCSFCTGLGECGDNLALLRRHGPLKLFPAHGLDRFIVLAPQSPSDPWDAAHLEQFTRAAIKKYPVDERRVFLTGISMGGIGAWNLVSRCPKLFAATVMICGRGDVRKASSFAKAKRPIWLFHSAADAFPVAGSDSIFDELRRLGAEVSYTRYRDLNHVQTWERAYESPLLYDWFLRQ
jgi:predicted peptidase